MDAAPQSRGAASPRRASGQGPRTPGACRRKMEDVGRVLAPAEWIALAQRSDAVTEPGPGERLAGEMSRPASSPSEWLFNEYIQTQKT